jgi:GT2 family glycosyltransferase
VPPPPVLISVAVPTLTAGDALDECIRSLGQQTFQRFEVVVVDNSGKRKVTIPTNESIKTRVRVIYNERNVGFGAAVNQVFQQSTTRYLATLNDDAVADPGWLKALADAAESHPRVGMFAPCVMLAGAGKLDSAGMLLAADGSSKQRGHGKPPEEFAKLPEVFFPSGSAALYRRTMLEQIGTFDESYFLYCEDSDLGLRARWAGWDCLYVPKAVVEHRYSHTAGSASPMKAYFVERNRLYTAVKNLPLRRLLAVPFASIGRYFWHLLSMLGGFGKTGEYRQAGHDTWLLPFLVLRAHAAALFRLPRLLQERKKIAGSRKISISDFEALARKHTISLREVASQ